jgi:hypothetical protein
LQALDHALTSHATLPLVTIQATSNMYVAASDLEGAPTAVKVGLGATLYVVMLATAGVGFYLWHRRRSTKARANHLQSQPGYDKKIRTTSPSYHCK